MAWIWTAAITLIIFLYLLHEILYSKKKKNLPPGPIGLPILGHFHLLGPNSHQDLQKLAQKHGPIMYMRFGPIPTVVVSSPAAAELFLKTHDLIFANRPNHEASNYLGGSSSLQVRRHTEGGRLIIEAVEAPFRNSYLQAERSDGRLKLCFFTTADDDDEEECDGDEEIESEFEGEIKMEKFQRLSRCKEGSSHGGNKELCSNWKPALWVATS